MGYGIVKKISLFSKFEYHITLETYEESVQDVGKWRCLYKGFNSKEEAQEAILQDWSIQNHPLLVFLYGKFFNKKVFHYRNQYAQYWGKDFWNV